MFCRPARTSFPSLAVFSFVALVFCAATSSAQTFTIAPRGQVLPATGVAEPALPPLPAGQDFASEVIGDAWDFEQESDWNLMFSLDALDPHKSAWSGIPQLVEGVFTGVANSTYPSINLQFEGVAGGFNMAARNGVRYPIDANRYRRLSFRVRRSVVPSDAGGDQMGAMWFSATTRNEGSGGALFTARGFDAQSSRYNSQMPPAQQGTGWQIYKVDLDALRDVWGYGTPWAGTMRGLDLRLGSGSDLVGSTIEVDWVQLTRRGTATATLSFAGFGGPVTVTARHVETGDTIQVFPDAGTDATTFPDGSTFTWDYGFLPPGTWIVTSAGPHASRDVTFFIKPAPIVQVLDPDVAGGRDFATTVIGDTWDFGNPDDVTRYGRLHDVADVTFGPAGLTATAQGPGGDAQGEGDAFVAPVYGQDAFTIPAEDTYGRLTFTLEYLTGKDVSGLAALGEDWAASSTSSGRAALNAAARASRKLVRWS